MRFQFPISHKVCSAVSRLPVTTHHLSFCLKIPFGRVRIPQLDGWAYMVVSFLDLDGLFSVIQDGPDSRWPGRILVHRTDWKNTNSHRWKGLPLHSVVCQVLYIDTDTDTYIDTDTVADTDTNGRLNPLVGWWLTATRTSHSSHALRQIPKQNLSAKWSGMDLTTYTSDQE